MNTKTFAQEARKILIQGVAKKLLYWGFNEKGETLEQPEKASGGYSFRNQVFDDPSVPDLWKSLQTSIENKGIDVIVEEAAYTWFNRIMALRILVKNGYEEPQLENATGLEHTPVILQKARQGKIDFLTADKKKSLQKILTDYSKDQEAFAILIKGYCHNHKTLQRVFGKIDDYTELLLPDNMLQSDGFLHLLNTTNAISDEDYQKVELIGWLYQFYISEKKDEVFASFKKGKKAEAKDIPAATQIFTPNWIVKYMVENTAGKIWLDKNPNSNLKNDMKYLVANENQATATPIISSIEELTLIDPAAGSGHILVEGFDLIYKMYLEEYYTPEEAVESILKNNLYGLDIDQRAAQLATFAILLKSAKVYPAIWSKNWLPNVYEMPESEEFSTQEIKDFLGDKGINYLEELEIALCLMKQAKNLGSVMKLTLSEEARTFIEQRFITLKTAEFRDFTLEFIYQKIKNYIPVLLILTKKYTSVVANPPYMGQKSMNVDLKNYVNANYPLTKSDLFAVFMEVALAMNIDNGLMGMINQHSWMFLSSYQKLREHILKNFGIVNMLHLGARTFEELSGEVVQSTAFVLKNGSDIEKGTYYRLIDYKKVNEKEAHFLNRDNEFSNILQTNFSKIPSLPISYWTSNYTFSIFEKEVKLGDTIKTNAGLQTGNNNQFLRYWSEVSKFKISIFNGVKFFPYNKAGSQSKWYGNQDLIINFENNAFEIKQSGKGVFRNATHYFKPQISWALISTGNISIRYYPKGFVFDNVAPTITATDMLFKLLGLLNSKVGIHFLRIINPTLAFQVGNISSIPLKEISLNSIKFIKDSVELCCTDWDSRETSWDFEQSPLLNKTTTLESAYATWQEAVSKSFFQLHKNEEELNRIFIDIYGLQDELTPEVALKDITILQEELTKKDLEKLEENFNNNSKEAVRLPINQSEVISQFISYAIGLFMGRYRLDKKGLNIAHPNPSEEELESYNYNNGKVIIDEDAIIPLMGTACNFPDDGLQQIYSLLDTLWGAETRTENINFIQECLNKDLESFLVTDFYKYHCKKYKKKPIYWLFSSKKGAFKVLVYMHRMNAFTVEKIRDNYLLEHIKNLASEITFLENNEANLNTQDRKKLEQLRKNLQECYDYEAELKTVADNQITFDLDDGVTVNYKKFETIIAKIK
ncbi:BREX-1 system adenine-specific DNA-methyltransferase PglX [Tenacibaculum finnmarkense]|uniref:BREX-1 system adenine-specific DNA-methyltransferase PglX n=1 Tax=Tenacibaculum finnmarkense TaxID=2781243 RepID=UPI001EFB76EA|nr:BREX-1 system adenine-specific DNA-methyltransferase PglX [Tenacibaculum finnmarkense]MCG8734675.1 BREX-1 system adenine-specific DNA-methyltransferase PglX [Tenacibaculum finnmarkense]MCG8859928.1 BREX-1 system adenine-specific DNA-methyltransferase PglX [Tenacibaculum finnmarkense]